MKKYLFLLLVVCLIHPGCDKGFEELNENPLFPTVAQDGPLFNAIIESLRLGWNRQLFLHNEKLYDMTELAVVTAETFGNVEGGAEDVWSNYYKALKNARELERRFSERTEDPEIANIVHAQLKIIMAYKTFQITDLFGDIPYSEAGRAFDEATILRPKYDDHETIYKTLIDDLIWASEVLTTSGAMTEAGASFLNYGSFDTFLGNDRNSWAQFSNSMLLRYLIRIYDKEPDYVAPRIKSMIETGATFVPDGGDIVMHPREQSWSNEGVNWSFREHNKVRMGTTLWDFMRDENGEVFDPRIYFFFEPNNDGEWVAFPQIQDADTPQSGGNPYSDSRDKSYDEKGIGNIYSSVNYYLIRDEDDIPEILITSAEIKFLLAEIFEKGIGVVPDPSLAAANYEKGMSASINFWQNTSLNSQIWTNRPPLITVGEMFGIFYHPKYDYYAATTQEERLALIHAQRWVDAFRQPWEAFSLMRRTNNLPREKDANTFYRFKYPPSESVHNSENYNAQVNIMGSDENDVKVWWME